jgi:site-specific recombinase XerD
MHVEEFLSRFYHQNLTFNQISITEIQEAIASKGSQDGCARASIRIYANSLRAFFRYAEMRDWCKAGLATAIMSPCVFREETLPAGPSWKDIQRLIASISDDNPTDIRDRAILMLIAIYGLRSSEVGKLRIEDINWEKEQILVRCAKQGQTQLFPLSYTVGEAILLYLKEVRPRCQYREVFLAMRAPIQPLTHTGIYCIVSKHLRSLDISTNHYGPHSLRHACASHLLAEGLSLKEIGDYLGHRSPRATRIYAKVDINGLREVADFQLGGLL